MPKAKVRRQIVLGLSYLIDCMRMRHFYASWCINRNADGGRELPAKNVQQLLGHSSIVITMDTYGHLFPASNDRTELEAASAALWT
jgi:integrase